jgi:hypothetical protein
MKKKQHQGTWLLAPSRQVQFWLFLLVLMTTTRVSAQDENARSLEIYGFAMLDMGYDFKQINPNWYDALRINRLPKFKDEFAPDGKVFFGVRQTRFGVKGYTPTPIGELTACYEFDMFGTGVDEGQTTMRLRYAYGSIGKFLAGQYDSPFMDSDLWPNTIEYWGPTGMVFFRNVHVRFTPISGNNELVIGLEKPGASADQGTFDERSELDSVRGQFNVPDISAHFKKKGNWGSIQLAGMFRSMKWQDIHTTGGYDISGSATGWGAHLSAIINLTKQTTFRGSVVHGEGIQNYMQDAPVDVGIETTGSTTKPIEGVALPITGLMAYVDHNWNDKWWTTVGYSSASIDNTDFAATTAYKKGTYATLTIGTTPVKNVMAAVEFQYGQREGENGFKADEFKIHFGFKYRFSQIFTFGSARK